MNKHYIATFAVALIAVSCQNNTETGALVGGAGGMAIGGAVGGWQGAAIGGAVGALAGAGIGHMMDQNGKKKEIKLGTLCEWKKQGMSEMDIISKLSNANLQTLSAEQIEYLQKCGFSDSFINWWQGQAKVAN